MDIESIGGGAATGFVATILTLLGWNRRISRVEDDKVDQKTCTLAMQAHTEQMSDIKQNLKDTKEDVKYIRDRIDRAINGGK